MDPYGQPQTQEAEIPPFQAQNDLGAQPTLSAVRFTTQRWSDSYGGY